MWSLPPSDTVYNHFSTRQELLAREVVVDGACGGIGPLADRLIMDRAAERADAATRTVYNHFSTRQELLAAVQAHLLQAFRDTLQLDILQTGEPAERLRQFVAGLYNKYEQQGAALTTVLELDEPVIRAQVRDMRAWRQDRLEKILRLANGTLRLPLGAPVAFAFVLTNHIVACAPGKKWASRRAKRSRPPSTGSEAGIFGASATHTARRAQSA